MFGVGFSEVLMIAIVALVVVGPKRLPEMLGTAGRWIGKLRNITSEMRKQTGIDEILREEGIQGGLSELRSLMRPGIGNLANLAAASAPPLPAMPPPDPYGESAEFDRDREYPTEGPDAYGAIPEDLLPAAPAPKALASTVATSTAPRTEAAALPAGTPENEGPE